MTQPNPADLLGYMLGALDATETQQIENAIKDNPDLEKELAKIESMVTPLEHLESTVPVPTGIARRTVEYVAGQQRDVFDVDDSEIAAAASVAMSPAVEYAGAGRNWSLTDVLVVCLSLVVLVALAIPAINYWQHQNRLAKCESNLRQVGNALISFREMSGSKSYLQIPKCSERRMDVAGSYAPILMDKGLVENEQIFFCAGNLAQINSDERRFIPTLAQIMSANEEELAEFKRIMGGDFGYSMGYVDKNGGYHPPLSSGRCNRAILADKPSMTLPGHKSGNHDGRGQNVWFDDGHIEFMKTPETPCGDAIYLNDNGQCAPSHCPNDTCIGSSCTSVGSEWLRK